MCYNRPCYASDVRIIWSMGTRHLFRFLWLFLVGHFLPGLTRQVSNVIAAACIVPRGGRVGLHSFMELSLWSECGVKAKDTLLWYCWVDRQRGRYDFNAYISFHLFESDFLFFQRPNIPFLGKWGLLCKGGRKWGLSFLLTRFLRIFVSPQGHRLSSATPDTFFWGTESHVLSLKVNGLEDTRVYLFQWTLGSLSTLAFSLVWMCA